MRWLDANESVLSYEYEPFSIEYISNKATSKIRRYFPDLLVTYDDRIELVEIKRSNKVNSPNVVKKTNAAIVWCQKNNATFALVTEFELKKLSLI